MTERFLFKFSVEKCAFGDFVTVLRERRFSQRISKHGSKQQHDRKSLFFSPSTFFFFLNLTKVKIITKTI